MEKNTKLCFRCKHFNRFYFKGVKRFNPVKCGWCSKSGGVVDINNSCEKCEFKKGKRWYAYALKVYLNNLLSEITQLRHLMEEEQNEFEE